MSIADNKRVGIFWGLGIAMFVSIPPLHLNREVKSKLEKRCETTQDPRGIERQNRFIKHHGS